MITLLVIWFALSSLFILGLCIAMKRFQPQSVTSADGQSENRTQTNNTRHSVTLGQVATQTTAFSA